MTGIARIARWIGLRGGVAILLGLACIALWQRGGHWQDQAREWEHVSRLWKLARQAEASAHALTKERYRIAQAEAARFEAERIARAQARQQEITDAASKDHAARLADLRARYQQLLDNSRAGNPADRSGAAGPLPGLPAAAGGTDAPASARLALTPDERLIAAEQALQLDALIEWIEQQAITKF